jgi:GDPmannose 4,6-dehydratase
MSRRALILGVTGQDGSYLAQFLIGQGYDVYGTSRDAETARCDGLAALGIRDAVRLSSVSTVDFHSVAQTIERVAPDEIYNLAGQSSVMLSFARPAEAIDSIIKAAITLLEAIKRVRPAARLYNAGSSECFGNTDEGPADETTAYRPRSPYGIAKAAAVSLIANYRESYGLFACSGLTFNHESPLRPTLFVTRKITSAAARIAQGSRERLLLGDLSVRRDWGWAPDYVDAMWRMLRHETPEEFVVASGISHSLEDFVAAAFNEVKLDWRDHVDHDPSLARPSEITRSVGNAAKAGRLLGWHPTVGFAEIVARMVRAEREGPRAVSSMT